MADWGAKLVQFPADVTWRVVDRLTASSEAPWPPPLGAIRSAILKELDREKPRALPEPPMDREAFRAGRDAVLKAIDGGSGPLAKDLRRVL